MQVKQNDFIEFLHHVVQVKLNIQKLRDTQKTLTQSVNALHTNELTEDQLKAPAGGSDFSQVQTPHFLTLCDLISSSS